MCEPGLFRTDSLSYFNRFCERKVSGVWAWSEGIYDEVVEPTELSEGGLRDGFSIGNVADAGLPCLIETKPDGFDRAVLDG